MEDEELLEVDPPEDEPVEADPPPAPPEVLGHQAGESGIQILLICKIQFKVQSVAVGPPASRGGGWL